MQKGENVTSFQSQLKEIIESSRNQPPVGYDVSFEWFVECCRCLYGLTDEEIEEEWTAIDPKKGIDIPHLQKRKHPGHVSILPERLRGKQ